MFLFLIFSSYESDQIWLRRSAGTKPSSKNHRSSYNPRTHSYDNYLQLSVTDGDDEITV